MTPAQLAAVGVAGWLWITTYFVTQAEADIAHSAMSTTIERGLLKFEISKLNTAMAALEASGVDVGEQRDYNLLMFALEHHTKRLLEIGE